MVMGIDPGAANLGFGLVGRREGRMFALDGGVIQTAPETPIAQRLERIHRLVGELIERYRPEAVALEGIYFNRNAQSAIAVGQASGVVMLAAAHHGVECHSYTPQAVKMAVCGSGAADKSQVQRMVGTLLGLDEPPTPDHAADALAVAICHVGGQGRRRAEMAGMARL